MNFLEAVVQSGCLAATAPVSWSSLGKHSEFWCFYACMLLCHLHRSPVVRGKSMHTKRDEISFSALQFLHHVGPSFIELTLFVLLLRNIPVVCFWSIELCFVIWQVKGCILSWERRNGFRVLYGKADGFGK